MYLNLTQQIAQRHLNDLRRDGMREQIARATPRGAVASERRRSRLRRPLRRATPA